MRSWIVPGSIILVNFLCACGVALLAGAHKARKHYGEWNINCSHWVCEMVGGGPAILLSLLVGPLFFLLLLLAWWFRILMRIPYLRSQRPLNEHPTARVRERK
jgi:hypothetical protein